MIIVYHCYGGTHSSALTAAVHLGKLPSDRIPTKQEIIDTPYFNKLNYKDMGRLIFHGIDENGNRVYTVGRGTSKALVPAMRNLAKELNTLYNLNDTFVFINTSPVVPIAMTLGGFFSRGLKIDFIGVPLLVSGAKQTHKKVIDLANRTKQLCLERGNKCTIIDLDTKGQLSIIE